MASGTALLNSSPVRMLIVGYPGAGKTGAIASLLDAGYKVRVLDFEGNYDPLIKFADPKNLVNLDVVTLQDNMRLGQKWIETSGIPTAFVGAAKLMQEWKYTDEDGTEVNLGRSKDWGPDTVVVIDSMTALAGASKRRAISLTNKTIQTMTSGTWGIAGEEMMNLLQLIMADKNRYHVIVLAHLRMISGADFIVQNDEKDENEPIKELKLEAIENGMIPTRLYPVAVTKNQSTTIHKEFPVLILAERKVKQGKTVRVLRTNAGIELDTKFPAKNAPEEVPLETGLAKLFELLGQKAPGAK